MPLFMCSRCGVVENTALSGYWGQQSNAYVTKQELRPLCSACNPAIGKWHGEFERTLAEGFVRNKAGHIYRPAEAEGYFKHMGPFEPVTLPVD